MKNVTLNSPTRSGSGVRIHRGQVDLLVTFVVLVAILVSFAFWCNNVKDMRDYRTNSGTTDYVAANDRRQTAFEGAVAGFVALYAFKHLMELLH